MDCFKCNSCNKTFSRSDNLKRHTSLVHGERKKTMFKCSVCQMETSYKNNLVRHEKQMHNIEKASNSSITLPSTSSSRDIKYKNMLFQQNVQRDQQVAENSSKTAKQLWRMCDVCNVEIKVDKFASHQRSLLHKQNALTEIDSGVYLVNAAFNKKITTYRIKCSDENVIDIEVFFSSIKTKVFNLISGLVKESSMKINFELYALFTISTKQDEYDETCAQNEIKSFNSKYEIITASTDLDKTYSDFCSVLKNKSQEFQQNESGWSLVAILYLEINLLKYNPLHASSYIKLPVNIDSKKAIINVQNQDQACFRWSILSAIHPQERNPDRVSNYQRYMDELNFKDIAFPVALKDISKFENQNEGISVNVFGLDKKTNSSGNTTHEVIGPLYHTKNRKETHVNLLYLQSEDGTNGHYCWIKHLSRLVRCQLKKGHNRVYICDGCLVYFNTESQLEEHLQREDCVKVLTVLPKEGKQFLEFKDFHKSFPVPFCIYGDFETILTPIQSCKSNPERKYVENIQIHEAHSFSYYVKCDYDDTLSFQREYRGNDCTSVFIKWLIDDVRNLYNKYFSINVPMRPLTSAEIERHESSTNCFICEEPFPSPMAIPSTSTATTISEKEQNNLVKVRDHDHFTGLYRGAAHMKCNLNYKIPQFIPLFLHNASNYDLHIIVAELASQVKDLDVIPLNKERYIALSAKIPIKDYNAVNDNDDDDDDINNYDDLKEDNTKKYITVRILDSYRFMASSLDSLVKNLESHQFVETRKAFPNDEEFELVTRKGVFPYEYVDDYERLETTLELPPREMFYSSLTETTVEESEYQHAQKVWSTFKCQNLGEYSDLYLKTDVLLLADVFESFRKVCRNLYKLDPCFFYTLPGLSWSAMMRYTKIKLELLTDIDMLHFIRKSIRGGIVQCSLRHAVANNRYMPERGADDDDDDDNDDDSFQHLTYDQNKETNYLIYLDANNLYGLALSQYLPHSGFTWLTSSDLEEFDVMDQCSNPNSEIGYILEVDLQYPQDLHNLHDEFPFCAENMKPPVEGKSHVKLIPNLYNKKNYVIHYRTLFQAVKHGLKVTKIHRILSFQQSDWLKKYIDLNTLNRQLAKNEFEKGMYKLSNNAIYGKCMEAVEKRVTVKLVSRWKDYYRARGAETLIASPFFQNISIFNENFVAIQLRKTKITFNKPIYVGFSVLDIAKTVMYSFHYEYIKKAYVNENAKLLYTDTDSLIYSIKTEDIYADIKRNIDKFDTSNYDLNNPYNIPLVNKAVLGMFKDEAAGQPILEFVGLRSKLYDYVVGRNTVIKKAKGVKKCVTKRLRHEAYRNCLFKKKILLCKQTIFRSIKHNIYTQIINKVAMSYQDDKRYILPDGIHTLAWGNYKLQSTPPSATSSTFN